MTQKENQLPNFIIGGTLKAGTTSVYTYLNSHPHICGSSTKETRFFNKKYTDNKPIDIKTYSSYFNKCLSVNEQKIVFEASPQYLEGGEKVAKRINKLIWVCTLLPCPLHVVYGYG